jgi:hypothetical protein
MPRFSTGKLLAVPRRPEAANQIKRAYRHGLAVVMDVNGYRASPVRFHDKAGVQFLDSPRRRETALSHDPKMIVSPLIGT